MQTLSLKTSKKLAELGVEIKNERYHVRVTLNDRKNAKGIWWIGIKLKSGRWFFPLAEEYTSINYIDFIPAPNLQEIFTALPDILERYNQKYHAGDEHQHSCIAECEKHELCVKSAKQITHTLTDTYLEKGMKGVDEELYTLLTNNK